MRSPVQCSPALRPLGGAPLALITAIFLGCGGKVVVDGAIGAGGSPQSLDASASSGSSSSMASSASASSTSSGTCDGVHALCESYCDAYAKLGCGVGPGCVLGCVAGLLAVSDVCVDTYVALVECTAKAGADSCISNYPAACWESELGQAHSDCTNQAPQCNGHDCIVGPDDCSCTTLCSAKFSIDCHAAGSMLACTCLRDGEPVGQCSAPGNCGDPHFPACCADIFVPPC